MCVFVFVFVLVSVRNGKITSETQSVPPQHVRQQTGRQLQSTITTSAHPSTTRAASGFRRASHSDASPSQIIEQRLHDRQELSAAGSNKQSVRGERSVVSGKEGSGESVGRDSSTAESAENMWANCWQKLHRPHKRPLTNTSTSREVLSKLSLS